MINWIRRKLQGETTPAPMLKRLQATQHGLLLTSMSPAALEITQKLQQAGYAAYIVGGAIRDLLLGKIPKDYDIATNATPEQIQACFRRALIIGKRFRLVHVYQGRDMIEVSTFRGGEQGSTDAAGRIVNDNAYGTIEEDAQRRDFTANALYYDPNTEEILDFHTGVADLAMRRMVMIGNPSVRYREDPVRILRAIRLAAKLDLTLEETTAVAITELHPLLISVPQARIFDELLKFLLGGYAENSLLALQQHALLPYVLPSLAEQDKLQDNNGFVRQALRNTDARISAGKPVSASFTLATLLWDSVRETGKINLQNGQKPQEALSNAIHFSLKNQQNSLPIPRRYSTNMIEIWLMQPRFLARSGKRPLRLLTHERFRAGYDFLCLRAETGEIDTEIATWWEAFQVAEGDNERLQMLETESHPVKKRKRPRRKARAPSDNPEDSSLIQTNEPTT